MIMVIECGSCGSRFRLAKSLFKDSRAIRVRCRKCGGQIVVENPDLPAFAEPPPEPAPPPEPVPVPVPEPAISLAPPPDEPVTEPQPSPEPPPAADPTRAMAELLREIEGEQDREPAGPPESPEPRDLSRDLPPELTRRTDSSYGTEALASALEDLFRQQPAPAAEREAVPPVPKEPPKAGPAVSAARKEQPVTVRERPPYASPLFVVLAVLWVLLLAGAALFFGTGYFDRFRGSGRAQGTQDASAKGTNAGPVYEVSDVRYFLDNAYEGGTIFAVAGNVTNVARIETGDIRIRALLYGQDNAFRMEKEVLAGNWIENQVLRHMKQDAVEEFLTRKSGSREIPKGESVPFMAVFFDPPGKVESIEVRAIAAPGR
ncbi:MAG: hypothetical protein AB1346_05810 [Thermodesulfobacteriota bacterium]